MKSIEWLMLNFTLPKEPSRVRVSTWRKLKKSGSVNIGQSTHEVSPSSTPLTVTTDKRALSKPKGLKLTAKKAKWKKVSNNNGYILKIMQGKKVIKVVQIKKGKTSYKIPKGLFKRGKRYIFTLVAKGRDNYKNSKTAKSKSVKIKK